MRFQPLKDKLRNGSTFKTRLMLILLQMKTSVKFLFLSGIMYNCITKTHAFIRKRVFLLAVQYCDIYVRVKDGTSPSLALGHQSQG